MSVKYKDAPSEANWPCEPPTVACNGSVLSAQPTVPFPARVATDPVARSTLRIRAPSTTYPRPPAIVIPCGLVNVAELPGPSTLPDAPVPATVVTAAGAMVTVVDHAGGCAGDGLAANIG